MSPKQILLNTLSFLVLLTSSFFVFHELSQPIADYDSLVSVYGLKSLSREDIITRIHKEKLNGKPLLLVNPLRISARLKHHPLIASVKVKRFLYPERKLKIYIKEAKLWANYQGKILNHNARSIVNLNRSRFNRRTQAQVNLAIKNLVQIHSVHNLSDKELGLLLKLCKSIEKSSKLHITKITGDAEKNYILHSTLYKFKIGLLDSSVLKRTERVALVLDQLKKLDKNKDQLDYIDLSLSSPEVILGKKINPPITSKS